MINTRYKLIILNLSFLFLIETRGDIMASSIMTNLDYKEELAQLRKKHGLDLTENDWKKIQDTLSLQENEKKNYQDSVENNSIHNNALYHLAQKLYQKKQFSLAAKIYMADTILGNTLAANSLLAMFSNEDDLPEDVSALKTLQNHFNKRRKL